MSTEMQQLIKDLAGDLKPEVEKIEASFETTQNHYGNYLSLISQVAKDRPSANVIAHALIAAGANKSGVISAFKILYA